MKELQLRASAKINLSLKILGLREDRFHEIDSVMQSISLSDAVILSERDSGIMVDCDDPAVPGGEKNLAYKAARSFLELSKVKKGVGISIKKTIPVAAGLAGGSADAAAVLIGLDTLFGANLSKVQLSSIGAEIGSDVPFCLVGGRCRVRGRGELVEQMPVIPVMHFVVVVPEVEISTKWAYEEYDRWSMRTRGTIKSVKSGETFSETVHNDLEEAISSKYPQVSKVKRALLNAGATVASMSGSGPSVFGMAPDGKTADGIAAKMKNSYEKVFTARSGNYGVKVI